MNKSDLRRDGYVTKKMGERIEHVKSRNGDTFNKTDEIKSR